MVSFYYEQYKEIQSKSSLQTLQSETNTADDLFSILSPSQF